MGRCAQTTVISGASRATKIFRTGPRAMFLLPAFFLTDGFCLCCWYCCSQDAFLTAAAVRARMVAAISTIRDENMCDGVIWFPLVDSNKTTNLYKSIIDEGNDAEADSTDGTSAKPIYLWDLIRVSKSDFSRAYTTKPVPQLSKHHGSSLVVRKLSTANFVAIASDYDDGTTELAVTPSSSNVAVAGEAMDAIAKKILTSLRSVQGTA